MRRRRRGDRRGRRRSIRSNSNGSTLADLNDEKGGRTRFNKNRSGSEKSFRAELSDDEEGEESRNTRSASRTLTECYGRRMVGSGELNKNR